MTSTVGVFSNLYLSLHRTSFQEFVAESAPSDIEKLFFSVTDFSKIDWIEEDREFELNGKLYDVSKIEQTARGFDIYCVNDSLEEGFIAMFDQWKKDSAPFGKARIIFQPQFCNQLEFELAQIEQVNQCQFSLDINFYNPPADQAPSPPPKQHV